MDKYFWDHVRNRVLINQEYWKLRTSFTAPSEEAVIKRGAFEMGWEPDDQKRAELLKQPIQLALKHLRESPEDKELLARVFQMAYAANTIAMLRDPLEEHLDSVTTNDRKGFSEVHLRVLAMAYHSEGNKAGLVNLREKKVQYGFRGTDKLLEEGHELDCSYRYRQPKVKFERNGEEVDFFSQ